MARAVQNDEGGALLAEAMHETKEAPPIVARTVFLDDQAEKGLEAPLSWKLTPEPFHSYQRAWGSLRASSSLQPIDRYFEPANR